MNLNELGLEPTDDTDILTARMKHQRDRLLAASDWTMHTDAPTDKTAWATYRQALRDFPATWEPNEIADFPRSPNEVLNQEDAPASLTQVSDDQYPPELLDHPE